MFKRLQHLPISLAAKCQLLFGAAVVLIISAALFWPWQRMGQLIDEINERSARALCDQAIAEHLSGLTLLQSHVGLHDATQPTTAAATLPATVPAGEAGALTIDGRPYSGPRLLLLYPHISSSHPTWFEKRSIEFFAEHPDADELTRDFTREGMPFFRYARPLRSDAGCLACHDSGSGAAATRPAEFAASQVVQPATTFPASAPAGSSPLAVVSPASVPLSATARPKSSAQGDAKSAVPTLFPNTPAAQRPIAMVSLEMPSQLDNNQLLLNRIFLLTAVLLAGTLAVGALYLITTRFILQPVHVLQDTAEKVSQGDLNIRSHISTGDEFEQLSKTLNTMLANLKAGQDQLRAINKSLDLKLGQLAESNVALYESNRLKSEFLANVSHELRTPLNSILGFAELLKDAPGADPRTARYVQNILTSGRNLLELINDLLDLAKIEAGRMEVRSEPLSLNDLFEGLTSIIKPLTEKTDVQIHASVAADVPIVQTDAPKLQQVLYNFLSNAIKFSPAHGQIELRADRHDEEHVRITTTDQGPGIEAEKQGMIFEKFRQIDGSVTRQHSGTGLGLAISKELCTLLGGTIGVESQVGQGATFWIILPLKNVAGAADVRQTLVLNQSQEG